MLTSRRSSLTACSGLSKADLARVLLSCGGEARAEGGRVWAGPALGDRGRHKPPHWQHALLARSAHEQPHHDIRACAGKGKGTSRGGHSAHLAAAPLQHQPFQVASTPGRPLLVQLQLPLPPVLDVGHAEQDKRQLGQPLLLPLLRGQRACGAQPQGWASGSAGSCSLQLGARGPCETLLRSMATKHAACKPCACSLNP